MHDSLVDMFVLTVPVLEKIVRPILVYLVLVLLIRLFGKRELAQLNPFDLVVLLTLANTVQNAIIGNDNTVSGGVIGAFSLLMTNWLVIRTLYKHPRLDRIVEGHADRLIRDGHVLKDHLNRELMTRGELLAAAHKQGICSLADVESATLEATGMISFVVKQPTPDTARHMELLHRLDKLAAELAELRASR